MYAELLRKIDLTVKFVVRRLTCENNEVDI